MPTRKYVRQESFKTKRRINEPVTQDNSQAQAIPQSSSDSRSVYINSLEQSLAEHSADLSSKRSTIQLLENDLEGKIETKDRVIGILEEEYTYHTLRARELKRALYDVGVEID